MPICSKQLCLIKKRHHKLGLGAPISDTWEADTATTAYCMSLVDVLDLYVCMLMYKIGLDLGPFSGSSAVRIRVV